MSRTIAVQAVLLLLLAASSCKSTDPLVGTWKGQDTGIGPSNFPGMSLDLRANGTYRALVSGSEVLGQWQATGDTVVLIARTLNGQDVSQPGMGMEELITPLTLQLSADKQSMTTSKSWFFLAGELKFTKG